MSQLALTFDAPPADADPPRRRTIAERFEEWLTRYPDRYLAFRDIAYRLKAMGKTRIGSKAIFEHMRMSAALEGRDDDGYRVNNVFSSRAARRLIEEDGSFAALFELRELRSQ